MANVTQKREKAAADQALIDKALKMTDWTQFVEDIKLPSDILIPLMTGRSEFFSIVKRDMTKDEVGLLLNAMRILFETNEALRKHAQLLSDRINEVFYGVRGQIRQLESLRHFAAFQPDENDEDDDS